MEKIEILIAVLNLKWLIQSLLKPEGLQNIQRGRNSRIAVFILLVTSATSEFQKETQINSLAKSEVSEFITATIKLVTDIHATPTNPDVIIVTDTDPFHCQRPEEYNEIYPKDCNKYYHCQNHNRSLRSCRFWQRFDPVKLFCRSFFFVDCNARLTTILPPTTATSALTSSAGTTDPFSSRTRKPRSISTLSNVVTELITTGGTQKTVSNSIIDTTMKEPTTPTKANTVTVTEEKHDHYQCIGEGEYNDVYPGDCQKYYHCRNHISSLENCGFLSKFDPIKLSCRLRFLVNCNAKPVTILPLKTTVPISTLSTSRTDSPVPQTSTERSTATFITGGTEFMTTESTQKTITNSVTEFTSKEPSTPASTDSTVTEPHGTVYRCLREEEYNDVYPGDCQKYYHCFNHKSDVRKCMFFKKFDPVTLTCRFSWNVDCNATPMTVTPPVTTSSTTIFSTKTSTSISTTNTIVSMEPTPIAPASTSSPGSVGTTEPTITTSTPTSSSSTGSSTESAIPSSASSSFPSSTGATGHTITTSASSSSPTSDVSTETVIPPSASSSFPSSTGATESTTTPFVSISSASSVVSTGSTATTLTTNSITDSDGTTTHISSQPSDGTTRESEVTTPFPSSFRTTNSSPRILSSTSINNSLKVYVYFSLGFLFVFCIASTLLIVNARR